MAARQNDPQVKIRDYDPKRDRSAVHRIWLETGWLEKGKERAMDLLVECGRALVAEIGGKAECLVTSAPGIIRYLEEDLPFSGLTCVATSRIARKQGLAKQLTAMTVAANAGEGALVCGLGMFEQGYYDQFGFGTGGYEHIITFDPSSLRSGVKARVPRRITSGDWSMVHASRLVRARGHGSCNFDPPEITRSEMLCTKNGFGLGYCDGPGGKLSHHFWCWVRGVEQGPYQVMWMTFQTREQFLELMDLIRGLGDQVRLVKMREPQGIQLQDLIREPFKQRQVSEKSKFESSMRALAYWQMRICDLPGCLERTHLSGDELRFNLTLSDPIEQFLNDSAQWRGLSGDYVITLGSSSGAEKGKDETLPTLQASVGAFTRLWLGVRPATGLATTGELSGAQDLLEQLDKVFCLPQPKPDWDF